VRRRLGALRRLAALALLGFTACTGGRPSPPPPAAPPAAPTPLPAPAPQPGPLPEELPTPRPRLTIEGTVTYVQRIALTPEAVVQVELRDAAIPEGEGPPIAKLVIPHPGQVPIAFTLSYLPESLRPGHRYVLSARVSDRGQLQFVTEQPIAALPRPGTPSPAPLEIVVAPVQ
jgi:putative lipoprotein